MSYPNICNSIDHELVTIPELEKPFELDEIYNSFSKCKNHKAPGENGIAYEFLKNLPCNWVLYLNSMFNQILIKEKTPKVWSNIIVKMMYKKKGKKDDLSSYRPIALANCTAKLFTTALNTRIVRWCEANCRIPEWQAGFREGRGCMDNIFVLNTIIQLHLRKERGKIYGLFVDFTGAFNTIDHQILWDKLRKVGLSSKLINIIRDFYSKSNIKISNSSQLSNSIKVTKGVLQGETLSPLLFALFLHDLESFMLERGIRGVSVNHLTEILLLAYADDIVFLADSYIGMKKVLKIFYEYCQVNKLSINLKKTKIILFQKGGHGHKKKFTPLLFGSDVVEYVKEYEYLGVTMTLTALFENNTQKIIRKAKTAVSATISLIYSLKINSWEIFTKLFESLVTTILRFASPVYAIRYLDDLEKIQLLFFKRLFNLPQCTPSYAVRVELGRTYIGASIFMQTLNWLIKIMEMPSCRYPRICFLKQTSLMSNDNNLIKYNWANQIKKIFF